MKKIFSEKDIPNIAEKVFTYIHTHANKKAATVVALSGELGAGKTTLVQALGKKIGISQKMASPTFVILKTFKLLGSSFQKVHHIDAYRLSTPEEIQKIRWDELVADAGSLVLVEWPEKIGKYLPKNAIRITLSHKGEEKRGIEMK